MKQLTLGDIMDTIKKFRDGGMSLDDVRSLPVYIGNDEELNGIHTAWYNQLVTEDDEDDRTFIDQINEDYANVKFNKRAFLIS